MKKKTISVEKKHKLKRRKKSDLKKAKESLWAVFSLFIKERDKYICFTCNRPVEKGTSNAQAGHFFPVSTCGLLLRYHERNCHCQCHFCNIHRKGSWPEYHINFIKKYGQAALDELFELKKQITDYTIDDYRRMTTLYEEKTVELKKQDLRN